MHRPTTRTTVLATVGGLGAAGALGLALAAGPAQAENPTPSPSASSSTGLDLSTLHTQRQEELAAALATELGIDKAKVAAALEKVRADRQKEFTADRIAALKTRLDDAVTAGTLTAAERDAILKAAESGVLPGGPGGLGGFGGGPGGFGGFRHGN